MAVLEGRDLETVVKQCDRIAFGKVTVTLYGDAVVAIATEEQRRVMRKPRGDAA